MTTDYKNLYYRNTLKLTKTIILKSSRIATLVNQKLQLDYGTDSVDQVDPHSWKYYLNLSGEYHPTDPIINILSLDTQEIVPFTKTTLATHPMTRKGYQYGSVYYRSLRNEYPDYEPILLGVLYPADIDKAIASEDWSILSYPKDLVESQELTLMTDLETWIKNHQQRWDIYSFAVSDSLYLATQLTLLYYYLYPKILNLRLRRCRTNEAHSFHIRNYLASHGRLDEYLPYLTLSQALFLYRNLPYIERNVGKESTFNLLVQRLLTDRHIPLSEFRYYQLDQFTTDYSPTYHFSKILLTDFYNTSYRSSYQLKEVIHKEVNNDPFEYQRIKDLIPGIDRTLQRSPGALGTKLLESTVIDYTDSYPYRLTDVLLNEWISGVGRGTYNTIARFQVPRVGGIVQMACDDALYYFLYQTAKSIGITLTHLPNLFAWMMVRPETINIEALLALGDSETMDDPSQVQWLLDNQPPPRTYRSVSAFNEYSLNVYRGLIRQWRYISNFNDPKRTGFINQMAHRLYADRWFSPSKTAMPYSEWFNNLGITDYDYNEIERNALITSIFEGTTGYNQDPTRVLANIQRALVTLLTKLSSYSIQISLESSQVRIAPLGWQMTRLGYRGSRSSIQQNVLLPIRIINFNTKVHSKLGGNYHYNYDNSFHFKETHGFHSDNKLNLTLVSTSRNHIAMLNTVYSFETTEPIPGLTHYQSLTLAEQLSLKDIYH